MKKLLMHFMILVLMLTAGIPVLASENGNYQNSNFYISEDRPGIDSFLPEGYTYKKLNKKEIDGDPVATKIYKDLSKKKTKTEIIESVDIYLLIPKNKNVAKSNTVAICASCNFGSYKYLASNKRYEPYIENNQTVVKQYLESWWRIYNPPSGHVGSFYKAESQTSWWERINTGYIVKNASMRVYANALGWCGSVLAKQINPSNWSTVTWKSTTPTISNNWVWSTYSYDFEPVSVEDRNYIISEVKADIYYGITFKKSGLPTQLSPNGL